MSKIDVEDVRGGIIVMNALVGTCMEMFEIRICDGSYRYWVREVEVPADVYRDALELATRDRYVPGSTPTSDVELD